MISGVPLPFCTQLEKLKSSNITLQMMYYSKQEEAYCFVSVLHFTKGGSNGNSWCSSIMILMVYCIKNIIGFAECYRLLSLKLVLQHVHAINKKSNSTNRKMLKSQKSEQCRDKMFLVKKEYNFT